jgi:hypothetical protein
MSLQPQFSQINSKGRNTQPLTDNQIAEVKAYALVLDIPDNLLRFSENMNTGYGNIFGQEIIYIGSDIAPLSSPPISGISANSRICIKGSLAHEWIGHRGAEIADRSFDRGSLASPNLVNIALDEAQASIRAARFAPLLTSIERYTLLRDSISRLKNQNQSIRQVRHLLFISHP